MNELVKIAELIKDRTTKERVVKNPSIAGGTIEFNGQIRHAWIVNFESESNTRIIRDINGGYRGTEMNGTIHTLNEYGKNSVAISKNRPIAQIILRQFGKGIKVGRLTYDILSSYIWGANVNGPIRIGTISIGSWQEHTLERLLSYAAKIQETKKNGDDAATLKAVKELEQELSRMEAIPAEAYRFIRQQAELRLNPILDDVQNEAKFDHCYDGVTEIIDGGPGTGKTTTLIQRLKYLITPDDIDAQREYNGESPLTKAQREILSADKNTWIFFSPTQLLRKYLRTNMLSEGLHQADSQTEVWSEYLQKILRDEYMLAGTDLPFIFKKKPLAGKKIFKRKTLNLLKKFEGTYLRALVQQIGKTAEVDYSMLPWKNAAKVIVSTCAEIKEAHSFTDLIRGLIRLEALRTTSFGPNTKSIKEITDEHNQLFKNRAARIFLRIQKNAELFNSLLALVASWEIPEDEDNELLEDESAQNNASQPRETRLNNYIRNILRNLALKKYDAKLLIKGRQEQIYSQIESMIDESDYSDLSEYAYFHKNFVPVVGNIESFLFGRISSTYKKFRANALKQKKEANWYLNTLNIIVQEHKNKLLHPHEQSLLLGFINNLILNVRKVSRTRYEAMTHQYAVAFKNCYRPIIGVDEATDYTIFDYYAISSLRHPDFSCVTLTGDIMQCLNESGITDWAILRNNSIFPKLDIKELSISYRQSPKLLKLADYLYTSATGNSSPYKGLQKDCADIPHPLWFSSDDADSKAEWIVKRILEVKKAYQQVPSIAIFVSSADQVPILKNEMEEVELLEDEGIDIVDCSNGLVDAKKDTVRIFPIDMVKGMEFEVVFFHNIQEIKNTKLIDRYLYIGLSRASFYMGVTSSNQIDDTSNNIKSLFKENTDWRP